MGYRAEKLKIEKDIKILKRVGLCVLLLIIVGVCIFSAFVPPESWKYYTSLPKTGKRGGGELRIHFVDVGQGDATIIEFPDGKTALIDGGNGSASADKSLLRYLNALKIKKLDYMILTHADADHCGGLDTVLKYKKVSSVYMPTTPANNTKTYAEFCTAVAEEECEKYYGNASVILDNLTGKYPYKFQFLHPYTIETDDGENTNKSSAVLWLEYNGFQAMFMGDAFEEIEDELLYDDGEGYLSVRGVCIDDLEVLKVSHHGSKYGTSENFLRYTNVETAIISCGIGNDYGHPHSELLNRLTACKVATWRTDIHENIRTTVRENGEYSVKSIRK